MPGLLLNHVLKHPLRLVQTFGALKKSCSECIYPIDSLRQFYKFYILSDMVLETLSHPTVSQNLRYYFLRDIIYYCLHCMDSSSSLSLSNGSLQRLALPALKKIIEKISTLTDINPFMEKHLNYICKSLVFRHKQTSSEEVKNQISTICKDLLKTYNGAIVDKQYMLNIFSNNQMFEDINKLLLDAVQDDVMDDSRNWKQFLEMFIENTNYTIDSFKLLQKHVCAKYSFGQNICNGHSHAIDLLVSKLKMDLCFLSEILFKNLYFQNVLYNLNPGYMFANIQVHNSVTSKH